MSLFSSQRSAAPLTENEKIMILNAHKYFSEENSSSKKRQKFTLRKRVAEVQGVSESTVGRVIHKWNECKNGSFAEQKNIGRPRLQPSPDIITLLRKKITNANKAVVPIDAYKAELLELVRQNKEKVLFACVEIAKQHGHKL